MRRRKALWGVAALVLGQTVATAIGQDRRLLDRASGSSAEIEAIEPPIAQRLVPGTKVKFSVDVRYVLAADSGRMSLFIQGPDPPVLAHQSKPLVKGTAKITLAAEVEVPKARRIDVIVALYHGGGQSTTITEGRTYEVARE